MKVGMLWFTDGDTLYLAVIKAAKFYYQKYGHWPTQCQCCDEILLEPTEVQIEDVVIPVLPSRKVLCDHLWLGSPEEKSHERSAA